MPVKCKFDGTKKLREDLAKFEQAPKKAMKATLSDINRRAPGWIATEVAKQYGVKKGEVNSGSLGKVRVEGDSLETVKVTYTGRVLTPTHFGMTPKAPPAGRGYTLKASIIKGSKATMGKVKKLTKKQRAALAKNFTRSGTQNSTSSPIMLMPTGSTYIPFQRVSVNRKDVEAIKTLSLPQMVSGRASDGISKAINENVGKRLNHQLERYIGK